MDSWLVYFNSCLILGLCAFQVFVVADLPDRGKGNYKVSRSTFACNRVRSQELTKWHVKEYDNVLVPLKDHGIFYSEEGYVIRWAYIITVVRELEGLTPGEGMFARDRRHRKQVNSEKKKAGEKKQGGDDSTDEKKKRKKEKVEEVNTSSEEEDNSDDECQRILESGGRDRGAYFFWQGECTGNLLAGFCESPTVISFASGSVRCMHALVSSVHSLPCLKQGLSTLHNQKHSTVTRT